MGFLDFVSRRKVIFPYFIILFVIIAFVLVYLFSLSQGLVASDASLSVSGENVIVKMTVTNSSGHIIRDPEVIIVYGGEKKSLKLKLENNFLDANESYDFVASIPISETTSYEVFLTAPFNKPIKYTFSLDPSTTEPVKANVTISTSMVVGRSYDVSVRLCNVSNSELYSVEWIDTVNGKYFSETLVPRQISLNVNECKNLYSTLTPVTIGIATMQFTLKVGDIVKVLTTDITITNN